MANAKNLEDQLDAFFAASAEDNATPPEPESANDWDAMLGSLPPDGPIGISNIDAPHPAKVQLAMLALGRLGRSVPVELMPDDDVHVYRHEHSLIQVIPRRGETPATLRTLSRARLRELVPVAVTTAEATQPRDWNWLLGSLAEATTIPPQVPELKRILGVPRVDPDGTVAATPGYDGNGYFLDLPEPWATFIPAASAEEARGLIDESVLSVFSQFPFAGEADQSAYLLLLFTAAFEYLIDGRTPLFAIDADRPGTGKSLLADCVGRLTYQRTFNRPPNPTNMMLDLFNIIKHRLPIAVFDNLRLSLNSDDLESFVTSARWTGREHGTMGSIDEPNHTVVIVTGNRLTYAGDLWRRVVPIRLEHPGADRPTKYQIDDLSNYLAHHRDKMLNAMAAAMQRFILDGCPQLERAPMRSLEKFDWWMRGLILYLGYPDPLEPSRLPKELTEQRRLRLLIAGLSQVQAKNEAITAAEMLNRLRNNRSETEVFAELAEIIARDKHGRVTPITLSAALKEHVGLSYGGFTLEQGKKRNNTHTFRISQATK